MELAISCGRARLLQFVSALLSSQFPDGGDLHALDLIVDRALERVTTCFRHVALPGYHRDGAPFFNHLHGDHSAVFLYYASNSAYEEFNNVDIAAKLMLLNKTRNAINVTYTTHLPEQLLMLHAVGTVLGQATYGSSLVVTQNVTVGTHRGRSPVLGDGVILYPAALVLGNSTIGTRARVAAGAIVLDQDVPEDSVAFGRSPDLVLKRSKRNTIAEYFSA